MSAENPTTSPEQRNSLNTIDIEGVPSHLQPMAIDDMREEQQAAIWSEILELDDNEILSKEKQGQIAERIAKEHLENAGVTENDPNYQEEYDFLRSVSADKISHVDWHTESEENGNYVPSKRSQALNKIHQFKRVNKDPVDTGEEPVSREDLEKARQDLDEYRKHYAHLLAEHSKKMGLLDPNKETKHTREELADLIGAIATDMADDLDAQGYSKEGRDAEIAEFIATQTDTLIGEMEEQRLAEKRNLKGWRKWVVEKWASWEPSQGETWRERMFSAHNFKNNLKKGVVFAVPGAIAGAALAIPLGIAGAGVFATGAAVLISRSIARNLGRAKLDSIAHADTIAHAQAEDMRGRIETTVEQSKGKYEYKDQDNPDEVDAAYADKTAAHVAHTELLDLIQDRSDYYRRRNRNRFLGGTAISIATTAGMAGIIDLFSPFSPGLFGMAGEKVSSMVSNHHESQVPRGGSNGGAPTEGGIKTPEVKPPVEPSGNKEFKILGSDERTISRVEGWYQTFREMGISAKHRAELLEEVGPYLKEKGLAYWDSNADEWRMNMTENGTLPTSAIRHIAETAHQHGWQSDYDKFFSPASDNSMNTVHENIAEYAKGRDESVIAPGEGGHEFMHELGIKDPQDRQAVWNEIAPQLSNDKLTYYDKQNSDWRLNMTPDGKMPISAIETAVETAQAKGINTDYTSIVEAGNHLSTNNSFTASQLTTGYNRDMKAYYDVLKNVDPRHKADVLSLAAHDLQSFKLTEKVDGVWRFREISSLPPKAGDLLSQIADKHNWTLAA